MSAHSKYSPSASSRWLNCPASIALEAGYKTDELIGDDVPKYTYEHIRESSKYADEGNIKHNEAAKLLLEGSNRMSDDDAINIYIEYCRKLITMAKNKKVAAVETEVSFESIAKGGFGTIDFFIIDSNSLEVVDFKYGRNRVLAEENSQLLLYAWGLFESFKNETALVEDIKLTIVQPRALDLEKPIDTYSITRKELVEFASRVKFIIEDNPKYQLGEHCTYCTVKAYCPAMKSFYIKMQNEIDSKIKYTNEELSEILAMSNPLKRFLTDIENIAIRKISSGETIPYYILKDGQQRSYWKDGIEEELIKLLGNKAIVKNMISITDAKRYLPKEIIDNLTYKRSFAQKLMRTKTKENMAESKIKDIFDEHEC